VLLAPGNRWAKEIIARRLGQKKESVVMRLLSSSGGERQQKGLSERAADWVLSVSPEGIWTGGQQQSAATLCYKATKWSRDASQQLHILVQQQPHILVQQHTIVDIHTLLTFLADGNSLWRRFVRHRHCGVHLPSAALHPAGQHWHLCQMCAAETAAQATGPVGGGQRPGRRR